MDGKVSIYLPQFSLDQIVDFLCPDSSIFFYTFLVYALSVEIERYGKLIELLCFVDFLEIFSVFHSLEAIIVFTKRLKSHWVYK
jgi:hypothetical protein